MAFAAWVSGESGAFCQFTEPRIGKANPRDDECGHYDRRDNADRDQDEHCPFIRHRFVAAGEETRGKRKGPGNRGGEEGRRVRKGAWESM